MTLIAHLPSLLKNSNLWRSSICFKSYL